MCFDCLPKLYRIFAISIVALFASSVLVESTCKLKPSRKVFSLGSHNPFATSLAQSTGHQSIPEVKGADAMKSVASVLLAHNPLAVDRRLARGVGRIVSTTRKRNCTMGSFSNETSGRKEDVIGGIPVEMLEVDTQVGSLAYAAAGPRGAKVALLLHGFPDTLRTWRHVLPSLYAKGLRVLMPSMRGYGFSAKPKGLRNYGALEVTSDFDALLAIEAPDGAAELVVGHDWGACVAWSFAHFYPTRLRNLAVLNVPHPKVFVDTLISNPRQLLKSWYIGAFQLPFLPEIALLSNDCAIVRRVLQKDARYPVDSHEVELHVKAMQVPGAMEAMVNYYRAAAFGLWSGVGTVVAPTLVLWGERDPYLDKSMADAPADLAPNLRVVRYPSATHWVQWDEWENVSRELLDHIQLLST